MTIKKYGSIENLYRSNEVLQHTVVVLEKIHGSNMRLGYFPKMGGLVVGSRNNIVYKDKQSTDQDGFKMGKWAEDNVNLEKLKLCPNCTFYGEIHGPGIQKGVRYSDEKDFRVFDIRDEEENFLDWDVVVKTCEGLGFKTVPVLLEGRVTLDDLNEVLNKNSVTAVENGIKLEENIAEGMVIKPLKMKRDKHGEWLRAKYKSEKWAENTKNAKVRKPDLELAALQTAAREFASVCVTPGRIATVVDHITRDGNIEIKMSRTGEFLRAFINDVKEEHADVYAELDKKQQNVFNKTVNGQASVLWKEHVMKQ